MEQLRLEDVLGTMRVAADPPALTTTALGEIHRLRARGLGPAAIARSLNRRRVPTPSGRGRWHPDTVRRHADPTYRVRNAAYMRAYRART